MAAVMRPVSAEVGSEEEEEAAAAVLAAAEADPADSAAPPMPGAAKRPERFLEIAADAISRFAAWRRSLYRIRR
jgi:hypothetical protein